MRRLFLALSMLSLAFGPLRVNAQLPAEEETEVDPAAEETYEEEADPYAEEEIDPSLREEELVEEAAPEEEAVPEEAPEEEGEDTAPSGDPSRLSWSTPAMAFTLHGYMRTRAEIWRNFAIGRVTDEDNGRENYPFRYFYPLERGATVEGGCSGPITGDFENNCYGGASRFRTANMRLRLQPTITVSDDIMVHMLVDALDNMVLGSTPNSVSGGAPTSGGSYVPGLTLDSFAYTMNPALAGRNSMQDSIYVRRAWAEIHAREIGQLWFGRMPNHWGLGMLFNDGAGIDGDFSSDVDRIMGIVQIQGFQLAAAWDFANQGAITHPGALNGVPFDATQRDDVRQFALIAAHRMDEEAQRRRIDSGGFVFNGGFYFQYRTQELSADTITNSGMPSDATSGLPSRTFDPIEDAYTFTRRNATSFTVDGWAQALWGDLRVELETALIVGHIGNTLIGDSEGNGRQRILQFGYALQAEYRALDRKLGIYFDHGLATGDAQVDGVSIREDLVTQGTGAESDRITTFSFHPNYRIDQILFRNILGSVNGVYYFRPGISYDLRRTDHGQIVGVRADAVYSRASTRHQAYGENANLGLELDASIYYRSELGPDALDGLYIIANYGLLFPLAGLGYSGEERNGTEAITDKTSKAQTFRLILGVRF